MSLYSNIHIHNSGINPSIDSPSTPYIPITPSPSPITSPSHFAPTASSSSSSSSITVNTTETGFVAPDISCPHCRLTFTPRIGLTLRNLVVYLILSPYDNEQHDLMHRWMTLRDLEALPEYVCMLKAFTTQELLQWDEFCEKHEATLRNETEAFSVLNGSKGPEHALKALQARVTEHNIRVISAYYTQIRLARLAELLKLDVDEAEKYLSNLVVKKTVQAKIDRLDAVVRFTEKKLATDVLNDWSHNINSLMSLINQTTHLINKERMVHAV
ncbi:26S proteasome non-ATPase regulatory subunit 12 [Sparganum proliferum]